MSWRRPRARMSLACTRFSQVMASTSTTSMFFIWREGLGGISTSKLPSALGLCPASTHRKIVQAGNTAIEGATIALLSKPKRQELEELVKRVEHCRLETHPDFFEFFVEGCQFKPVEPIPCAT